MRRAGALFGTLARPVRTEAKPSQSQAASTMRAPRRWRGSRWPRGSRRGSATSCHDHDQRPRGVLRGPPRAAGCWSASRRGGRRRRAGSGSARQEAPERDTRSEMGDFGGDWLEHPGQWLGAHRSLASTPGECRAARGWVGGGAGGGRRALKCRRSRALALPRGHFDRAAAPAVAPGVAHRPESSR